MVIFTMQRTTIEQGRIMVWNAYKIFFGAYGTGLKCVDNHLNARMAKRRATSFLSPTCLEVKNSRAETEHN